MLGLYTRFRDFFVLLFQSLGWNNPLSLAYLGKFNALPSSGSASIPPSSGSSGADGTSGQTLGILDPISFLNLSTYILIGPFRFLNTPQLPYRFRNQAGSTASHNEVGLSPFQGYTFNADSTIGALQEHHSNLSVDSFGNNKSDGLNMIHYQYYDGVNHYSMTRVPSEIIIPFTLYKHPLQDPQYKSLPFSKLPAGHRFIFFSPYDTDSLTSLSYPAFTLSLLQWPATSMTLLHSFSFEIILHPDQSIEFIDLSNSNSHRCPPFPFDPLQPFVISIFPGAPDYPFTFASMAVNDSIPFVYESQFFINTDGKYPKIGLFGLDNPSPSFPNTQPVDLLFFQIHTISSDVTDNLTQIVYRYQNLFLSSTGNLIRSSLIDQNLPSIQMPSELQAVEPTLSISRIPINSQSQLPFLSLVIENEIIPFSIYNRRGPFNYYYYDPQGLAYFINQTGELSVPIIQPPFLALPVNALVKTLLRSEETYGNISISTNQLILINRRIRISNTLPPATISSSCVVIAFQTNMVDAVLYQSLDANLKIVINQNREIGVMANDDNSPSTFKRILVSPYSIANIQVLAIMLSDTPGFNQVIWYKRGSSQFPPSNNYYPPAHHFSTNFELVPSHSQEFRLYHFSILYNYSMSQITQFFDDLAYQIQNL